MEIYDISAQGTHPFWPALSVGVGIVLVSLLNYFVTEKFYRKLRFYPMARIGMVVLPIVGTIFILISFLEFFSTWQLRNQLQSGEDKTIEGVVTYFFPGKITRPAEEQTFIINGIQFFIRYSATSGLGGFPGFSFETTPNLINPLGKRLRIDYIPPDNIIRVTLLTDR